MVTTFLKLSKITSSPWRGGTLPEAAAPLAAGHRRVRYGADAPASDRWTGPARVPLRSRCTRVAPVVEATGVEPATTCLQSRSSTTELRPRSARTSAAAWWAYVDSNHRLYAYQAYALTT